MTFDAKHKKSSQAICSLRRRGGEEGIRLHFSQRTPYLKKKPCRAKNKCVHRCAHRFTHMPPACADMIRIPLLCFAKRKTPSTGRDFRPQTKLAKFASKERKDHGIRFCRSSVTAKHHEASQASSHADVRRSSRRSVSAKHGENYALFPPSSFTKSKQML